MLKKMNGVQLIYEERLRQVEAEDYTLGHDLTHKRGELAMAAATYAMPPDERIYIRRFPNPVTWPARWTFKPGDRIRELVKAGALIAAEIDRLTSA
jgi:hypothetical protein